MLFNLTQLAVVVAAVKNEEYSYSQLCEHVAASIGEPPERVRWVLDSLIQNRILVKNGWKKPTPIEYVPSFVLSVEGQAAMDSSVNHLKSLTEEIDNATRSLRGIV